jgi:hypothetical protein
MSQVIEEVRVTGPLRQRRTEVAHSFDVLAGFDLRDSQSFPCADLLQMRYGFRGVALRQKSVAEKLMRHRQIRTELQRVFQGSYR